MTLHISIPAHFLLLTSSLHPGPTGLSTLQAFQTIPTLRFYTSYCLYLKESPPCQLSHSVGPSYDSCTHIYDSNGIFSKRLFLTTQLGFSSHPSHVQFYYLFTHFIALSSDIIIHTCQVFFHILPLGCKSYEKRLWIWLEPFCVLNH